MRNVHYVERIPQQWRRGHDWSNGFGRHIEHDPRSLRYLEETPTMPIRSVAWERHGGPLDQRNLGGCTGYALAGVLATEPFGGLPATDNQARALYSRATRLDAFPGQWPKDDTGSTGLAVAKGATEMGLISGYTHATSLLAALGALQRGPVITGVRWSDRMMTPESDGEVRAGGNTVGGHEFEVSGVDEGLQRVWCWQSWGPDWGLGGRFYLTFDTWAALLADDGDVTVPIPLASPAPEPMPGPLDPDLDEFVKVAEPWATRAHTAIAGNSRMATATRNFLRSKAR